MIDWQKLYEDRERLFWTLHIGGWLGFALVYYVGSFLHDMRPVWVFIILLNATAGWLLSIPLRYAFRKVSSLYPPVMLLVVLLCCYAVALLWTVMKNLHYWELYKFGYRPEDWYYYFKGSLNSFFILMCWSGLYYGIKNYQLLQKEKQNALKSSAMAHQAHIKMLRYQLNPHFLFNTLNNLYALTLAKSDVAPAVVMKLSDMLDYILYQCNEPTVTMQQEVDLIQSYIDLEKLRHGARLQVTFQSELDNPNTSIAPLILLSLVENAFKHGAHHRIQQPMIDIYLRVADRELYMMVENTKVPQQFMEGIISANQGIGKVNLQRQLTLNYYKLHHLTIEDTEEIYRVTLTINL